MDNYGFPFASLENEHLRLDYLTTTGPRIVGLYVSGVAGNLLASTPEVHWETLHGEYYLLGGHRLWVAPENPFYTCPEEGLDMLEENGDVVLRSPVDASGLQKEIRFRLDENSVHLQHCVTWHGTEPAMFAPWSITQLRLGGMAILPLEKMDGLQPDRNLVLWPYSRIRDERFELHDDVMLLYGKADEVAFKIGNENRKGWLAYVFDDVLFVKRFMPVEDGNYPDMDCNVEAYIKDVCLELETLGELKLLKSGEVISHEEIWEVFTGKYTADVDDARRITKQLSENMRNGE